MQSTTNLSNDYEYIDCSYRTVADFLHHCHLDQYLDIFISEGFDSVTSLLEITEEDMVFMNVKRGHRRLIQREIATVKGIPRDQPLSSNLMGSKYQQELMQNTPTHKMENAHHPYIPLPESRPSMYSGNNNNIMPIYENVISGLPSPRSMNSGVGSNTSGSSSGSNMRSRLSQPGNGSGSASIDSGISSQSNMINTSASNYSNANESSANTTNSSGNDNSEIDTIKLIETRSNSISSNDDADSVDTNESVPTKRKYRRHAKPDRNAPVKPPSAYIMFSNDSRAALKDKNLSFAELAKIVGDKWKNLSHIEKQSYERMAMRAKDEYLAALEHYRQTPQYRRYQEYLSEFKSKQDAANRIVGKARKRVKQPSPGSGSIADSSSNGNSNGNGSSGSGSADTYGDKESVLRRQRHHSDDEISRNQQDVSSEQTDNHNHNNNINSESHRASYHHHHPHHHSHEHQQSQPPLRPQPQLSSDSGYLSQSYYGSNSKAPQIRQQSQSPQQQQQNSPNWSHRSSQMMRGMLPVEFVHHTPVPPPVVRPPQKRPYAATNNDLREEDEIDNDKSDQDYDDDSNSHGKRRRSPRFNQKDGSMHALSV